MPPENFSSTETLENFKDLVASLYSGCADASPNFGVTLECFQNSLSKAIRKYLFTNDNTPAKTEIEQFLNDLNINDLFMAIACSNGSERAWWEFDQHHRTYLERVA
ncbi:MAG: hypothetical protein ABI954_06925, partial [Pyrinomonadaceae bacterium]